MNSNKVSSKDIINKLIVIDGYEIIKSKFTDGNCYLVGFHYPDDSTSYKFFTSSKQVMYILEEISKRDAFPRIATLLITKNNSYYLE